MKSGLIVLLLLATGCRNSTDETLTEDGVTTMMPTVEVVEPYRVEYTMDDVVFTITASTPFEQLDLLKQWYGDQKILTTLYTDTDQGWASTLNGLTNDTPTGIDERMIKTLLMGQLLNRTNDTLSPLVLSNTYFNAYDYIHLDADGSTITIDTPLEFIDIDALQPYVLADQLIHMAPPFTMDYMVLTMDERTIVLNSGTTYAPLDIHDPNGKAIITVNLIHNHCIESIGLTNDDLDQITFISSNPTVIALLKPYLDDLTYDQIDQLINALQKNGYSIHAIYFKDGSSVFDPKYSYGSTNITWTTSLDAQLMPKL